jgi:uncharacterized protein
VTIFEVLALIGGGLAAGALNAIAGGGSLITFPLLVGIGLPGVAANVSNALSVAPGYVASVAGSRADLVGQGRRIAAMVPAIVLGVFGGSALLLFTPREIFDWVVPFLVLLAAAMMAFQTRLRALSTRSGPRSPRRQTVLVQVTTLLSGLYGGYFNAAMGLLAMAGLSLVLDEQLRRLSALKNVFSAVVGVTTVLVYSIFGPVDWLAVAVLAPATMAGGFAGARLARRLPSDVLRRVIVAFGTIVGLVMLVRQIVAPA